ncbi:uncharacterized protein LOC135465512 [Liolophura sinensis]|uniref:uncharacterized protein LOC135465512 n=1 Tax=Liolophura sinensis TaxID=3198878 RepID=UPI003158571F
MTVTMSGLITRAALFLYIFILHDSVVMGAVIVSAPSPLVGRVHKDSIPLECTFWSTDGTEVVATMTWTKQTVHGRKFRQLLEVQIPMSDDADVRYRDSSLIQQQFV